MHDQEVSPLNSWSSFSSPDVRTTHILPPDTFVQTVGHKVPRISWTQ